MKLFAVCANIVQLVIILYLFVVEGLSMGLMLIFALFFFMLVPFINFLALLFTKSQTDLALSSRKSSKAKRPLIKRQALRVAYLADYKAVLRIKEIPYEVVDVSEGGIRFLIGQQEIAKRRVAGELSLLRGDVLEVKGQIEERQDHQAALILKDLIPFFILSREKAYVDRMIRNTSKNPQ
jgi:hypothetical protein